MKTSMRMIIVLTLIAILSGGILSLWNDVTAPRIEQNRLKVLKQAITLVLPGIDHYQEQLLPDQSILYMGIKEGNDAPVGYAFKAIGNGFSPDLTLMVGTSPDFSRITGIEVLEHTETPGLGNKIEDQWFKDQFKGLYSGLNADRAVVKNVKPADPEKGIQAVSGATISSKAVVTIVMTQLNRVKSQYMQQVSR